MKWAEFYPGRQARPGSEVALDMDIREPSIPPGFLKGVMLQASYLETAKTSDYTLASETVVIVDAKAGNVTLTLPVASTHAGRYYYIKKVDSTGHAVTLKGDVKSETIDGEKELELKIQYAYVMVLCDGDVWHILGGEYVKMEDLLYQMVDRQDETNLNLGKIERHLAEVTDLELKEEDTDDHN